MKRYNWILISSFLLLQTQIHADLINPYVEVDFPHGEFLSLEEGVLGEKILHRYYWHEIPDEIENEEFYFWQIDNPEVYPNHKYGITTFRALEDGNIWLACGSDFGTGGNPSGTCHGIRRVHESKGDPGFPPAKDQYRGAYRAANNENAYQPDSPAAYYPYSDIPDDYSDGQRPRLSSGRTHEPDIPGRI